MNTRYHKAKYIKTHKHFFITSSIFLFLRFIALVWHMACFSLFPCKVDLKKITATDTMLQHYMRLRINAVYHVRLARALFWKLHMFSSYLQRAPMVLNLSKIPQICPPSTLLHHK